ncbi:hypothetical protein [Gracilimonas sp.]|uniref:hypothetical protein n=1 Tax=Gracilimonas sp. TaxID=1974203 RepID=UPI0032EABFD8
MRNSRVIKLLSALLLFSFTIISCGEDPVSSNEDPPVLPEFENVEPDLSYFTDNPPQNSNSNYSQAYGYGVAIGGITSFAQIYTSSFTTATSEDASFEDGQWVWEYTYSYQGESASVSLIAEESDGFINWEMTWTIDSQEFSLENYTILEGRVATDGSSGNWTFNNLNSETNTEEPFLVTEWSVSGENNFESETDYYQDGSVVTSYTFTQNSNEFTVTYSDVDSESDITVFWDNEAGTGYYQSGSDSANRLCWDDTYQDVTCSSVGY